MEHQIPGYLAISCYKTTIVLTSTAKNLLIMHVEKIMGLWSVFHFLSTWHGIVFNLDINFSTYIWVKVWMLMIWLSYWSAFSIFITVAPEKPYKMLKGKTNYKVVFNKLFSSVYQVDWYRLYSAVRVDLSNLYIDGAKNQWQVNIFRIVIIT